MQESMTVRNSMARRRSRRLVPGNLTVKLGSLLLPEQVEELRDRTTFDKERDQAIEALKSIATRFKKTIRHAAKRAFEKEQALAEEYWEQAENVPKNVRPSVKQEIESKARQHDNVASEIKTRFDWVYRDEIEDMLSVSERVYLGQTKEKGKGWDGGFWRWSPERTSDGHPMRVYVDWELVDRCAVHKMTQIEEILESDKTPTVKKAKLVRFAKKLLTGR